MAISKAEALIYLTSTKRTVWWLLLLPTEEIVRKWTLKISLYYICMALLSPLWYITSVWWCFNMPEIILKLLEVKPYRCDCRRRLNASVDEVKACMTYLANMGYIKSSVINPTETSCSGNCSGCSSCTSCNTESGSSYTMWEVV